MSLTEADRRRAYLLSVPVFLGLLVVGVVLAFTLSTPWIGWAIAFVGITLRLISRLTIFRTIPRPPTRTEPR
jgi:hypothetical protein